MIKLAVLKKPIALFFLFIFLFNSLGFFFVFKFNQYELHKDARAQVLAQMPNTQLICIPVTKPCQVSWTEENEFSWNGNLYDVVRSEKKSDGTMNYYCLNDSKEEELFSKLDDHLSNELNTKSTGKTGKLILKLLAFDYFLDTPQLNFYNSGPVITCFIPVSAPSSHCREITTPPPRIS
jgi:hypothetical protein